MLGEERQIGNIEVNIKINSNEIYVLILTVLIVKGSEIITALSF